MVRSLRRGLLILMLIALMPLFVLPTRAANQLPPGKVGPGDVYLALGDSLATGTEAAANDDGLPGYPDLLFASLRQINPAITFTNLGVGSGETSSSFIVTAIVTETSQLDRAVTFITTERAAGRVVSPVTLSIGGNDAVAVVRPGSTTNVDQALTLFRANLIKILDDLVAALTVEGQRTGDLLIMNYYNPYPGLYDQPGYQLVLPANPDIELPRFNAIIEEEAVSRGIAVVDVFTPFQGREAELIFVMRPYPPFPPNLDDFDFHPREAGHRVIADHFFLTSGYRLTAFLPLVAQ
ncbi:SGNH/GDSL hydrolase family protein [Candidatus Chloroploca sp. Khr17]|uniref:SGNH/GDSL hydrolase family protein n=1 Tax=Candidatus Chloroploca sp. Khr17 TaxID=2496869 RepID=UPI00101E1F8D|nr:SGNH/GDSL hydrolase family protein [Candidatus Chloroploca sp. Khr17]